MPRVAKFEMYFKWLSQQMRMLKRRCGVLRLDGRELTITKVSDDEFEVQDVYALGPTITVKRDDTRITELQLHSEFLAVG